MFIMTGEILRGVTHAIFTINNKNSSDLYKKVNLTFFRFDKGIKRVIAS